MRALRHAGIFFALFGAVAVARMIPVPALSEDPDAWLADIHGVRALAWVQTEDSKSDAALKSDPAYKQDYDWLLSDLDSADRLPLGRLDHGEVYNF